MLRDAPSFAVYFMVYEGLCRCFNVRDLHHLGAKEFMLLNLAGGVAGMVSWGSIYPIDVVKTNFQAQSSSATKATYVSCACSLYQAGGWRIFLQGLGATSIRAFH